jgi:hypothetical protein
MVLSLTQFDWGPVASAPRCVNASGPPPTRHPVFLYKSFGRAIVVTPCLSRGDSVGEWASGGQPQAQDCLVKRARDVSRSE